MWQKQFRHAYGASAKAALYNLHLMFSSCVLWRQRRAYGGREEPAITVALFCTQSELIQEAMEPIFFNFVKKKNKILYKIFVLQKSLFFGQSLFTLNLFPTFQEGENQNILEPMVWMIMNFRVKLLSSTSIEWIS